MTDPAGATTDLLITVTELVTLLADPIPVETAGPIAAAASGAVRDYCRWRLAGPATQTVTLTTRGEGTIFLPSLHVTAITDVRELDQPMTERIDFDWDDTGALERIGRRWPRRRRAVTATITHGYDRCPDDVAQAIAAAVGRGVFAPASGVVSESTLSASVKYASNGNAAATSAFLPHELAVLDKYRIGQSR
ncbi:hypothetical protein [Leifsonia aquatica]|uniref:hypothetical protein n=1 Tax=Leifsonia aquatica TaxID=144185 RepID=UPI00046884FB|nr:hypothetical protein [Leifsonia aquatica]